jgi:hypothetical protein
MNKAQAIKDSDWPIGGPVPAQPAPDDKPDEMIVVYVIPVKIDDRPIVIPECSHEPSYCYP